MSNDPAALSPSDPTPAVHGRQQAVSGWMQWLCGGIVLAVLVGVSVPAFSEMAEKADRSKSLSRAKQIGLCLKLFAGDNDGDYPKNGVPEPLKKPTTANAAFAPLLPVYTQSEMLFGDELSAYQTRKPDNVVDNPYTGKPVHTLEPGENVYGYMMGLSDSSHPNCPLVFDGTDGTGYYTTDAKARGGVGGGVEVIVIRLDNHGALEPLSGPPNLRFVPLGKALAEKLDAQPDDNLLDAKLYGDGVRLLDPAVDPQDKR